MASNGTVKKSGHEFQGEIVTLSVQAKGVRIVPETNRASELALALGRVGILHQVEEVAGSAVCRALDKACSAAVEGAERAGSNFPAVLGRGGGNLAHLRHVPDAQGAATAGRSNVDP
jgi:hypothetical protein